MSISFTFKKSRSEKILSVILPVTEGAKLGPEAKNIDRQTSGFISHALEQNKKFKGKHGEVLEILTPPASGYSRLFLLGLGQGEKIDLCAAHNAGGKLYPTLKKANIAEAVLISDEIRGLKTLKLHEVCAGIAAGIKLRSYDFGLYKAKSKKDEDATPFARLEIVTPLAANARDAYEKLEPVIEGTFTARNLVNTPPNDLYPESYAKIILSELKPLGVEIEILDEKKMQKLGMGAILAVGQGSSRLPRMVILRWNGNPRKKDYPLAFVGKGVTFDTGGISIKPGPGMDEMTMDMAGSAAVVGLFKTLALRKAKVNVVGVVGLAENMPSGHAYRPGDIITALSGKTIEVLNTDAEGRLVLADCLTHVQRTYKPKTLIDLATLTGAIIVALGNDYCGTFANDDKLWSQLDAASKTTGEQLWRMPLDDSFAKQMESDLADLRNIAKDSKAGSCTGAGFLRHFIEDGVHWAHLDIAGTAYRKSDQPTVPKFGTGFGVRLLNELVAEHYEG